MGDDEYDNFVQPDGNVVPIQPFQDVSQPTVYQEAETPSHKGLIIGVVCVFLLVTVGLFVFLSLGSSENLSGEDIKAGKSVGISKGDSVKFVFAEEEHKVIVDSVGDSSVEIIVQSDPVKATLNVGETKYFDLDGDGKNDLSVKLEEIVDGEPVLFVREFSAESQNCINSGGYVCTSEESCAGTLINTFGEMSCCNVECIIIDSYEEGSISYADYCSSKDKYLFVTGDICKGILNTYYSDNHRNITYFYEEDGPFNPNTAEAFYCCSSPVSVSGEDFLKCVDNTNCNQVCMNCNEGTYVCNYDSDPSLNQKCVECIVDSHCVDGYECEGYVCVVEGVEVAIDNETNVSEVLTCFESGGDICSDVEICEGNLLDVSDSDFCCDEACGVEEIVENISDEEFCSEKGMYLMSEDGLFCGGEVGSYYADGRGVLCCTILPVAPVELSDELRSVWESIESSGECVQPDYISKLNDCSPYKCSYYHELYHMSAEKAVLGEYSGECHSFEVFPDYYENHCSYDVSQLNSMVNYLTFIYDECGFEETQSFGEGTCIFVNNESGDFVNGILTENILMNMIDDGDCITFGL